MQRFLVTPERLDRWSIVAYVGVLIFARRIGIPVAGFQVPLAFFAAYFFFAYWLNKRKVYISQTRALLYLLHVVAVVALSSMHVVGSHPIGFSSLVYFLALYPPLLCVANESSRLDTILHTYQRFAVFFAALGIGQFVMQIVGLPIVDYMALVLPDKIIISSPAHLLPVGYGLPLTRANGVFFFEPSDFSVAIGLAIIIECLTTRRSSRMALFGAALLAAVSGTGVLLTMVGLSLIYVRPRRGQVQLAAILIVVILVAHLTTGMTDHFVRRTAEFSNPYSSGYLRFIAPYQAMVEFADSSQFWTGAGAGNLEDYGGRFVFRADPNLVKEAIANRAFGATLAKLLIEYGIFDAVIFGTFLLVLFYRRTRSYVLSTSALFIYLFLCGGLLQANIVFILHLVAAHSLRPAPEAQPRRRATTAPRNTSPAATAPTT